MLGGNPTKIRKRTDIGCQSYLVSWNQLTVINYPPIMALGGFHETTDSLDFSTTIRLQR